MMSKLRKIFVLKFNSTLLLIGFISLLGSGASLGCGRKSGCPAYDTMHTRLSGGKEMPKAKRSQSGLFPKKFK